MLIEKKINRFLEALNKIRKFIVNLESFSNEENLNKLELMLLSFIYQEKELIMSKLAKSLGISLSTATVIVDNLVKKKLILRKRISDDRRIVKVLLTKKGENIALNYQKKKKELIEKMLTMLSEKEQENFILILEKIAQENEERIEIKKDRKV
ncbi:MAG: MarR family transcriptional regulator [Armatimonadetes bacterium]|nr:MarR family transcriptional regulator [Armatimonadota bacterium]